MEDFVVKYFVYFASLALAAWSFCMFIGMLGNCIRMGRKYSNPDEKMSAYMTKCRIETAIYFVIPIICAVLVLFIHNKYNT